MAFAIFQAVGPGREPAATNGGGDAQQSRYEVIGYLTDITAAWTMVHYTPDTCLEDGDHIAMFGRCAWRNKATDKVAEVPIAALWRSENGQAVALQDLFDTATAATAATP